MADYSTLPALLTDDIECFVFDSLPSTNDYLSGLPFSNHTQVCITTEQTHGKGQYNRAWLSQKDSSILFSIRLTLPTRTSLTGLSLVVGLAVLEALEKHKINHLKLKWANDVYFEDKKLAGILIENTTQNDKQSVIIGLGVNHNFADNLACPTPWIDIKQILGAELDAQNLLALSADLIKTTIKFCDIFAQTGFEGFHAKWRKYDYLLGKNVTINNGKDLVYGKCAGVNQQGLLLINTKQGIQTIASSMFLSLV